MPGSLGMVTKTDLLNGLVLGSCTQDSPLEALANVSLVTVAPEQYLFEALIFNDPAIKLREWLSWKGRVLKASWS